MSFAELFHYTQVAVAFLLMISVLVAAHELGHYLFARMFKMGVEEFAIGMGKRLFVWKRKTYEMPFDPAQNTLVGPQSSGYALEGGSMPVEREVVETPNGPMLRETTDFTVRAVPIGGFVRIKGMMPEEDGSEVNIAGGFYSKPPWQRLIVLFMGPVFSVLAGIAILIPLLTFVGVERLSNEPVVAKYNTDSPAGKAGIKLRDRFVAVDGQPVDSFYEVVRVVRERPGQEVPIRVERDGRFVDLKLVPELEDSASPVLAPDMSFTGEVKRQGKIGAEPRRVKVPLPFGEAVAQSFEIPLQAIGGLVQTITQPKKAEENVGGIVSIAAATSSAVEAGLDKVLLLSALISISVGIFNLLPIHPLDGGQMIVAFAEMLRKGRRLSIRVQSAVGLAGIMMVLMLVVGTLYVDFKRLAKNAGQEPPKVESIE